MAHLSDELFDDCLVKLKRALGVATCAMSTTSNAEWVDYKPAIEYALWQVQENLCDVVTDMEGLVEYYTDHQQIARVKALHEAAELVEKVDAEIATAIRHLAVASIE